MPSNDVLAGVVERDEVARYALAFERLEPKLRALPEDRVPVFFGDPFIAALNVRRCARALAEDEVLITELMGPRAFDPADYQDLEARADSLLYAEYLLRREGRPKPLAGPLRVEAVALRSELLLHARYLWRADPAVADLLREVGRRERAPQALRGVVNLLNLFRQEWDRASGRCTLTAERLQAIGAAAERLQAETAVARTRARLAARDVFNRAAAYADEGVSRLRALARFVHRDDPSALDRYPPLRGGDAVTRRRRHRPPVESPAPPESLVPSGGEAPAVP